MGSKALDLTKLWFGKLEVLERAESDCNGNPRWRCLCHGCGREVVVRGCDLRSGNSQSCGVGECRRRKGEPVVMPEPEHVPRSQTLCFDCRNATGGCSWSARLEPVPGWDAVTTMISSSLPSYHVRACPLFEPD